MHPKESRLQHAAKGLNRSQAELMYMLMVKKKKAQADGKKGKKQNDRCILWVQNNKWDLVKEKTKKPQFYGHQLSEVFPTWPLDVRV